MYVDAAGDGSFRIIAMPSLTREEAANQYQPMLDAVTAGTILAQFKALGWPGFDGCPKPRLVKRVKKALGSRRRHWRRNSDTRLLVGAPGPRLPAETRGHQI